MVKYVGIISFIIYLILLFILVVNMHRKNKIIKYGFLILFIISIIILVITNDMIVDTFLKLFITYVYYPSFSSYMITLFLTLCILVYSIFNDHINEKIRIVNYVFASLMIISYIIFMLLDIDVNMYSSLYLNSSLICLRYVTRTFIIWLLVLCANKYYRYFVNKRW